MNYDPKNEDLPLGLGMALSQNVGAMQYFASLSRTERKSVIDKAHTIKSKSEMQAFVDSLRGLQS